MNSHKINQEIKIDDSHKIALRNFKKIIENTQKEILNELCSPAVEPKLHAILVAINKTISQELITETAITLSSGEKIRNHFNSLYKSFNADIEKSEINKTHETLYMGLRLVLQMYEILAVDVMLQPALAKINADQSTFGLDQKHLLHNEANVIREEVELYNKKIKALNERNYEILPLDYKNNTELNDLLSPLFREEKYLKQALDSDEITNLQKEHKRISNRLNDYELKSQAVLKQYIEKINEQHEWRLKLFQSDLQLDLHYVDEFANSDVSKRYTNIKDRTKYIRQMQISGITQQLMVPLSKFEEKLIQFKKHTFSSEIINKKVNYAFTPYQKAVNGIFYLLIQMNSHIRKNSPIVNKHNENIGPNEYLKNDLPTLERKVENEYVASAKKLLADLGNGSTTVNAYRKEIAKNMQKEEESFKEYLNPQVTISDLNELTMAKNRIKKLDDAWRMAFDTILGNELENIKIEFNKISVRSIAETKLSEAQQSVTELRHRLWKNKADPMLFLIAGEGQCLGNRKHIIQNTIYEICEKYSKDLIFKEMDSFLGKKNPTIPPPQAVAVMLKPKPPEEKKPDYSEILAQIDTRTWYEFLTDTAWKKSIWLCLGVIAAFTLALTGWGLIAGIAAVSIFGALGGTGATIGVGMSGGVLVGGGYYAYQASKKCCHTDELNGPVKIDHSNSTIQKAFDVNNRKESNHDSILVNPFKKSHPEKKQSGTSSSAHKHNLSTKIASVHWCFWKSKEVKDSQAKKSRDIEGTHNLKGPRQMEMNHSSTVPKPASKNKRS